MNEQQVITLTIGKFELSFQPTQAAYNDCMNLIAQGDVSTANHNFCFEVATEESKEKLRELLKSNPGATLQIGGVVVQQFAPKLDIVVKK